MTFIAASFLQAFCAALYFRLVSTTAADSAIRCRCGMAFIAASFPQAFCTALPLRPVSTTAANSAIRCRCGMPLRNRIPLGPCHRLSHHTPYPPSTFFHLPKVCRIPVFSSHLPKVRGVVTASRAPCARVSPATVAFPPSEGAQFSLVFVSPSEGAWSRHCFESTLCPCFSSRRAFPTFRRCAEASLLRERPVSVFLQPPCVSHLPKVCSIPPFSSHLPKVCRGVIASRAPCVRVSPAAVHFPPSEGAQISLVFVSPSEGVQFQNEKAGCALS